MASDLVKTPVVAHDVGNFVNVVALNVAAGLYKKSKSPAADFAKDISLGENTKPEMPFYPILYKGGDLVLRMAPSNKQLRGDGAVRDKVWWTTYGLGDNCEKTGGRLVVRQPLCPDWAAKTFHWLGKDSPIGHRFMGAFINLCKTVLLEKLHADFPEDKALYNDEWFASQLNMDGGVYEGQSGTVAEGKVSMSMFAGQFTDVFMADQAGADVKLTVEALCNKYIKGTYRKMASGQGGNKASDLGWSDNSALSRCPMLICPTVRIAGFGFYKPAAGGPVRCGLRLSLLAADLAPVQDVKLHTPVFVSPARVGALLPKRKAPDAAGNVGVVYVNDDDDEEDMVIGPSAASGGDAPPAKKAKK